ncbi:hypothetical protein LPUS_09283 [Lasallia pustulata]|uniref:Uncharacterized protein n=1 Tax=Lasallia pustulata TaxID=136370 RepID=A0A1W5D6W2_9LECA|nr:hypothetical protein LPUS_09283 [Lasallia pustulata]
MSLEPDASCLPSGEKATAETQLEWPSRVCNVAPIAASQIRTVMSLEPDASCLPSGEKATAKTHPEWPSRVCNVAPIAASQIRDGVDPT